MKKKNKTPYSKKHSYKYIEYYCLCNRTANSIRIWTLMTGHINLPFDLSKPLQLTAIDEEIAFPFFLDLYGHAVSSDRKARNP